MRHARLALTLSMGLLALAMVLPAHLRGLVSAARCPQLLLPHSLPTGLAAIALAAVTTSTDSKKECCKWDQSTCALEDLLRLDRFSLRPTLSLQYAIAQMIGRMIRAFGADDVATLTPAKFRKLRFLMIANTIWIRLSAITPTVSANCI